MRTSVFRWAAASLAVMAALSIQAQPVTAEQKKSIVGGIYAAIQRMAFVPGVDFTKWDSFIGAKQAEIDEAKTGDDLSAVVNSALDQFGCSHIRLLTPNSAQQLLAAKTVGTGLVIDEKEDGLLVRQVFTGSPGAEAGIAVGDTIIEVDGLRSPKSKALAGEAGQKKSMLVRRQAGGETTVVVELRNYNVAEKETLTWPDPETAVLTVPTFLGPYNRANVEKLVKEAAHAKRLVVDVRMNHGGSAASMLHLLSTILPAKTDTGVFVDRQVHAAFLQANPDASPTDMAAVGAWTKNKLFTSPIKDIEPFKGRVAVLISNHTGSAAEITAASLKEAAGAITVGQPTAGKVLPALFAPLSDNFVLLVPISDYVTSKGVRLEGNPVKPDITCDVVPTATSDEALEKAIQKLKEG